MQRKSLTIGVGAMVMFLACPWSVHAEAEGKPEAQVQTRGTASAENVASVLGAGTSVQAVLETKVDARTAKVGDTIEARTARAVKSGESMVLPRGSKLLGRISMVEAGAEARGESRLGVAFDRAVLPDGKELAVDLAIQAIAAGESEVERTPAMRGSQARAPRGTASRTSGGGLIGGTVGGVLETTPEVNIASDVDLDMDAELGRSLNADGTLSTSSEGVIGLRGLELDSTGTNSVLVRSSGPVSLTSGTRLLLRAKGRVSPH